MYNFYFAIHLWDGGHSKSMRFGFTDRPACPGRHPNCADGELRYPDLELNRFLLCLWATSACCAYGKTRTSNFTRIRRVLWPLNYISLSPDTSFPSNSGHNSRRTGSAESGGNDPPRLLHRPQFSKLASYLSCNSPFWQFLSHIEGRRYQLLNSGVGVRTVSNRLSWLHKPVHHLNASNTICCPSGTRTPTRWTKTTCTSHYTKGHFVG